VDHVRRYSGVQKIIWHFILLSPGMAAEDEIVPDQQLGARKDIIHKVQALDQNDAQRLFLTARNRLVDVNHWEEYSALGSFQLVDGNGNEVFRTAEIGDYFRINIKAPGPVAGDGYDWVKIEAIADHSDVEGYEEHMAMRVRPAQNPLDEKQDTAHFFSDESTSTFLVKREGTVVTASVFGRNEVPNTSTSNLIDKLRNQVVATSAIAGLSNIQWRSLVTGLLPVE
jgi:hypothetical protein